MTKLEEIFEMRKKEINKEEKRNVIESKLLKFGLKKNEEKNIFMFPENIISKIKDGGFHFQVELADNGIELAMDICFESGKYVFGDNDNYYKKNYCFALIDAVEISKKIIDMAIDLISYINKIN